MITIIVSWIFLFVVVTLLGRFFSRTVLVDKKVGLFENHWIGFIFLIVFLQIYSLGFSISVGVWLVVIILTLLGLKGMSIRALAKSVKDNLTPLYIIISLIIIVTAAYSSGKQIIWGDTYLYHLDMVRLASEFKVIPGLANLSRNYGINSSFFLFAAFIDTWVFEFRSAHIALGYMGVVTALQWLKVVLNGKDKYTVAFCVLSAPYLFSRLWGVEAASFSTDFAQGLMILLFGYYFLLKGKDIPRLFLLGGLGALVFIFKLNGAFYLLLSAAYLVASARKIFSRSVVISLIVLSLLVGGFVIRNIIISGWLVYPVPISALRLRLPWSLQNIEVEDIVAEIRGWVRTPVVDKYKEASSAPLSEWLPDWVRRKVRTMEFEVSVTTLFFLLYSVLYFQKKVPPRVLAMIAVSAVSIFFVMYSAPEFRYAYIYIWTLLVYSLVPFLTKPFEILREKGGLVVIFIALVIFFSGIGPNIDHISCPFCVRRDRSCLPEVLGFYHLPQVNEKELGAYRADERKCSFNKKELLFRIPGKLEGGFNNPY